MDAPAVQTAAVANTCVVGCKLPHGLNVDLVVVPANKKEKRPAKTKRVRLKGANSSRVVGGYGITHGVDRELFARWLKDHADTPYVRDGSVFMVGDSDSARSEAAN